MFARKSTMSWKHFPQISNGTNLGHGSALFTRQDKSGLSKTRVNIIFLFQLYGLVNLLKSYQAGCSHCSVQA